MFGETRLWRPVLRGAQSGVAVGLAERVGLKLSDVEGVETAVAAALEQTHFPGGAHWLPHGMAQGHAGLALLCGYLDACDGQAHWDVAGHQHLELAGHGAEGQQYLGTGLFSGLSGLGFAAAYLSRSGTRYGRLLSVVDDALSPRTFAAAASLGASRRGIAVGDFDVISGLSGIGTYLLCRHHLPNGQGVEVVLDAVLRSLVDLTGEDHGVPRWYTPPDLTADERMRDRFPHGSLNCGLAHGIPGPLSVLALAKLDGIEVEGQSQAIDSLARWLCDHRLDDEWGVNWPSAVPLLPPQSDEPAVLPSGVAPSSASPFGPSRTAWCYGSPGVARALWLAGEALDRQAYRALAVAAMQAVYRRPLTARQIDSPTFCHGVAGLLQITLRFAHDTGDAMFAEAARTLCEQLLSLYEPDSLLGFRAIEPGGTHVDHPGLLDGAPGVALVLLAAATNVEPTWDRLFLLS